MAIEPQVSFDSTAVPPIILLVEDDADTRDMYSLFLESSGMWVATAPHPRAASEMTIELKPDLIITDLEFGGERRGLQLAHDIKRNPDTAHVPVVLLSGRTAPELPSGGRADADVFLLKPVVPDELLIHVRTLLRRSRELRARNSAALSRAAGLMQRSNELMAKARAIETRVNVRERRCPACVQPLQWVETGRIDGVEYDYYHWCDRGCGLYCYDRAGSRWVKLAGCR